jgi:hypothetical protein
MHPRPKQQAMQERKRKKLAAKGWRLGVAKDFLGLTPEEVAYIAVRLKLAASLKKRRHMRGASPP